MGHHDDLRVGIVATRVALARSLRGLGVVLVDLRDVFLRQRHRHRLPRSSLLLALSFCNFSLELGGFVEEGPRIGSRRLVPALLLVRGVSQRGFVRIPRVTTPQFVAHGFNLLDARLLRLCDLNLVPLLHSLHSLRRLHRLLVERDARGSLDLPYHEAPLPQRAALLSTEDGSGVYRVRPRALANLQSLAQTILQPRLFDRVLPLGVPQLIREIRNLNLRHLQLGADVLARLLVLQRVPTPRVALVLHLLRQLHNLRVGGVARRDELPLHELQLLPHGLVLFRQPRLLLLRLSRRLGSRLRDGVSQSSALPESHPGVLSREREHELPGRGPGVVASLAHALGDVE